MWDRWPWRSENRSRGTTWFDWNSGSVGGDENAGGRRPHVNAAEGSRGKAVGEQPASAAQNLRMNREDVLVDKTR